MVNPSASAKSTCPACGAPATGKFCSNCGAALGGTSCPSCNTPLARGAKFCHRCGKAVAAPRASEREMPRSRGAGAILPWAVAGVAIVALIALVTVQKFTTPDPGTATAGAPMTAGPGGVDIANMSPEERAMRLFNRVMSYSERGITDSVAIFAPMAISSYEMLGTLNTDQRYDLGRLAEVTGDLDRAAAQADTILRGSPDHLLGLVLAADVARKRNETAKARQYLDRLVKAAPSERAKQLPEYEAHANDINAALAEAGRR